MFQRFLFVWLGIQICSYSAAQLSEAGSLAKGPFPKTAPQILIVNGGQLGRSLGATAIEDALTQLRKRFGVRINQQVVAGYILDLDQHDKDQDHPGFDLDRAMSHPFLAPWFHDPMPMLKESREYTRNLWEYAQSAGQATEPRPKITYAVASTHIDHVFFPLHKFTNGFYLDKVTGEATGHGLESVLHEALHIWHFRNLDLVSQLLTSPGGFHDRVSRSESVCPNFLRHSESITAQPVCGYADRKQAMMAVLNAGNWPQRYGALTSRQTSFREDRFGCSHQGPSRVVERIRVCVSANEFGLIGDLHGFSNDAEYFAILMQLYIFSPKDFVRVATPEEYRFAEWLFSTVFK